MDWLPVILFLSYSFFYVGTPSGIHLLDHLLWPIFQSTVTNHIYKLLVLTFFMMTIMRLYAHFNSEYINHVPEPGLHREEVSTQSPFEFVSLPSELHRFSLPCQDLNRRPPVNQANALPLELSCLNSFISFFHFLLQVI